MYNFIRSIGKSLKDYVDRGIMKTERSLKDYVDRGLQKFEEYDLVLRFYSPPEDNFPSFEGIINGSVLTVVSGSVNNVITKINNNEPPKILMHCEHYSYKSTSSTSRSCLIYSTQNIDVYKLSYLGGSDEGGNEDYGIRLSWFCYESDNFYNMKRIIVDFDKTNTIVNGNMQSVVL